MSTGIIALVPSTSASDMPIVQHAAHRNFQALLDGGVRILDDRSFETNDEITVGFLDAALARRLEEIFEDDARHCVELSAESWRRRGLWHRLQDNALYLFNEVL